MMTVLTAVVTTVAVTGATSNAVDSTVASFWSVARRRRVGQSCSGDRLLEFAPAAGHRVHGHGRPQCRACGDQMAFATVGDTRVMLLGIAPGSHRDIYTSMSTRDRERLLAGEGVALSRDLGHAMGVTAGDEVVLQTPTGERRVQVLELVPYFSGLTGIIAMSLDSVQGWFLRPGASDHEVTVSPGADSLAVRVFMVTAWTADVGVHRDGRSRACDIARPALGRARRAQPGGLRRLPRV